ncbi:hypothetical protein HH297_11975, partial [Xanthomonas sp. Kuri4-3]
MPSSPRSPRVRSTCWRWPLLSTPKHAMGEADLIAQIELCKKLLAELPYSDRVTVTRTRPSASSPT